jgi:hypothetical protein
MHTHPDADFAPRCPRCKYAIKLGDLVERGYHADCWKERKARRVLWVECALMTVLVFAVIWLATTGRYS